MPIEIPRTVQLTEDEVREAIAQFAENVYGAHLNFDRKSVEIFAGNENQIVQQNFTAAINTH